MGIYKIKNTRKSMTIKIGVDVGGTKIEVIALNSIGETLARQRVATPRGDYEATLRTIADLVFEVELTLGERGTVGIGTPGAISPATGLIKNANSTWLNGQPFDRDLEKCLQRPVRLANDANCFTLSEAIDGAAAGAQVVFGVIIGTGTGGGIAIHQQILQGGHAIAGEWGHNPLPWQVDSDLPLPPCYCGKQGCIETYLSGSGLTLDFERQLSHINSLPENFQLPLSVEQIVELAMIYQFMPAQNCLARYADRVARSLATVINILDPDVIVLGGGLSNIAQLYENVPVLLKRYVFSDEVSTRLVAAAHGDSSGVRGAAWLW